MDGLGHTFSAVINGVEHAAADLDSLVQRGVTELAAVGIAPTGSIAWLVRYLIEQQEDPVHVVRALSARITSLGGDVIGTLEEVAFGVMTHGLYEFARLKVEQAVAPLNALLNESSARGQAVADVHRTTLGVMRSRLDLLRTGDVSGVAWQGPSVAAMSASFDGISSFINDLGDQIQHDGAQDALNKACLVVLAGIVVVGAVVLVLDIIATAVVELATVGGATIPVLIIDSAVVLADLGLVMELAEIDLLFWILGTLAIYAVHHVFGHPGALPAAPLAPPRSLPTKVQAVTVTIGGGAGAGGTTVVRGGDGTGADVGGLPLDVQQDLAWDGARANARARDDYVRRTGRGDINYALGFLQVNARQPPEPYGPVLGYGPQPNHSEQKIVDYWVKFRIPQLGLKPGDHLILLIITRVPMCPACQARVPEWMNELGMAAGAGVTVHLYLWQSIDPTGPVGPGNLEPVP